MTTIISVRRRNWNRGSFIAAILTDRSCKAYRGSLRRSEMQAMRLSTNLSPFPTTGFRASPFDGPGLKPRLRLNSRQLPLRRTNDFNVIVAEEYPCVWESAVQVVNTSLSDVSALHVKSLQFVH